MKTRIFRADNGECVGTTDEMSRSTVGAIFQFGCAKTVYLVAGVEVAQAWNGDPWQTLRVVPLTSDSPLMDFDTNDDVVTADADPVDRPLQEQLRESLDWIHIRSLAAGRIAELLAYAQSGDSGVHGELAVGDLQRMLALVQAWQPGQPPRGKADVDAAGTIAHLRRRVAQLEKAIGDLTRTMKP